MIIDLKKLLFIGVKHDINQFFARAQKAGFLQFLSKEKTKGELVPEEVHDIVLALKVLRKQSSSPSGDIAPITHPVKYARTIIETDQAIEKLLDEKRLTNAEIARIKPLGHFSLKEVRQIEQETGKKVQFFCMKESKRATIEVPESCIFLKVEYDLAYFMSVSDKLVTHKHMIEMHLDRTLLSLEKRLDAIKKQVKEKELFLAECLPAIPQLTDALLDLTDDHRLHHAKEKVSTPEVDALFSVVAYLPISRLQELEALLEGLNIFYEEVAIDKDEIVPTHLENTKTAKLGEDLVGIYDTPSREDKDPSIFVFWAFIVFFAMIISDAGYGLIYLGLALLMRFKIKKPSDFTKRFISLFTTLSIGCIAWGVITGSYFGMELTPDNPLQKISLLQVVTEKKAEYHLQMKDDVYDTLVAKYPKIKKATNGKEVLAAGVKVTDGKTSYEVAAEFNDNILIELSLLIGALHIMFSLLRYLPRNFAALGWSGFIIGGYLFFPSILNATSMLHFFGLISKGTSTILGKQLLFGGIGGACVLSLIQNGLSGIQEITRLIEVFADILSYLRLYALGLAGMMLSSTFNSLAESTGYLFGFFILLMGHGLNITLGVMGGTIHGLRLNFIEWYHYSFEGGGKLFKPLKLTRS